MSRSKSARQRKTQNESDSLTSADSEKGRAQDSVERRHSVVMHQSYAGPLPHHEDFAAYERILPGSADRILTMAEQQARHRQEVEKKKLEIAASREEHVIQAMRDKASMENDAYSRGQLYALLVAVTGLSTAAIVAYVLGGAAGASAASVIGGTALASLVYAFLRRSKEAQSTADLREAKKSERE